MRCIILRLTVAFWFMLVASGCGALLPSAKKNVKCPYSNFGEAKQAFDKILVNETTCEQLAPLGFDPFTVPNIEIVTYLDLINRFMPNPSIKFEDLDPGLRDCIQAKDHCRAYEVELERIYHQRYGNVFMDMFNFRRNTKRIGWRFHALIIMKDDLVVYKIWSGKPSVDEMEEKKNPLGPLQNSEDFLLDAAIP